MKAFIKNAILFVAPVGTPYENTWEIPKSPWRMVGTLPEVELRGRSSGLGFDFDTNPLFVDAFGSSAVVVGFKTIRDETRFRTWHIPHVDQSGLFVPTDKYYSHIYDNVIRPENRRQEGVSLL